MPNKVYRPHYQVEAGCQIAGLFEDTLMQGFERITRDRGLFADEAIYKERMALEQKVIVDNGLADYFMLVADYVGWAKKQGIAVGPGRGSVSGSLVAYLLGITTVDPIRHGLLFERFINPSDPSQINIDVDFCSERRDEVVKYIRDKYGPDKTGLFTSLKKVGAKDAIVEMARVMGVPLDKVKPITRELPRYAVIGGRIMPLTVAKTCKLEPRLEKLAETCPELALALKGAKKIEKNIKSEVTDAAGIVVADRPLWELAPVKTVDGWLVVRKSRYDCKKAGLMIFNLLGWRTLASMNRMIKELRSKGKEVDGFLDPIDDPAVYQLLSEGETGGIFQLESTGMTELLQKIRPSKLNELVAITALYRPGPLMAGLVDEYIARKSGKHFEMIHPALNPILSETFGLIVYQEQVMKIAESVAGFSIEKACGLREALGKKQDKRINSLSEEFTSGVRHKTGMRAENARLLWEQVLREGSIAFIKAHSVGYAIVTCQTAWLKTRYPREFSRHFNPQSCQGAQDALGWAEQSATCER